MIRTGADGDSPDSVSVILSTYRQPAWLEKALWGYAVQTHPNFEIVIADDGSGPETAEVIRETRRRTDLEIRHVWQEDRGFRKTVALNRAIVASAGEYLIFSDGDCVPRCDFVEVHCRLARPGRFLSGGVLPLDEALSRRVSLDDVRAGRAFDPTWLIRNGWRPGRRLFRMIRSWRVSTVLDRITPTSPTWNGHNASTWRDAVVAVNGFDGDMGYGSEDRAFGVRLEYLDFQGQQVRHRAVCVHLAHDRPYVTEAANRRNRTILDRIRASGESRARSGIAELPRLDDVSRNPAVDERRGSRPPAPRP